MKRTWFARVAAFALALGAGAGAGFAFSASNSFEADAAVGPSDTLELLTSASTIDSNAEYVLKSSAGYFFNGTVASDWGLVSNNQTEAATFTLSGTPSGFTAKRNSDNKYAKYTKGKFNFDTLENASTLFVSDVATSGTGASGDSYSLVQAHYSDTSTNPPTEKTGSIKSNGGSSNKMRWYDNIGINDKSGSTSFPVQFYKVVPPDFGTLTSISVSSASTHKINYKVGEAFSSEGLVITAKDNNNIEKNLTSGFTLNLAESTVFTEGDIGTKTVEVSYTYNEVTKTTTFNLHIFGNPAYAASLADDFVWDDFENGVYYTEKAFVGNSAVDGVTPEWMASSIEVYSTGTEPSIVTDYVIGDYVATADPDKATKTSWSNFASMDSFAGIAKGLTDNDLSGKRTYAMFGKNFAVQGLSRVILNSTKATVAGFSAYVLGSKDGGYTWSLLGKNESISSGAGFSVEWAGDDYADGSNVEVAFVFATTSTAQRPGIQNISFELYGAKLNSFSAWEAVSLSLGGEDNSVEVGSTLTLPVTCSPAFAASAYNWSSSDTNVATVADGVVTGVAAGSATITVSTLKGAEAEFDVTVVNNIVHVTGVTLDKASAKVTEQSQLTLTATVSPEDASNKNINWSSSDETVATVADGVVTAIKAGTTTITVTTVDGEKTATCEVTVEPFEGKYVLVDDLDMLYNGAEIIFGNETARVVAKYNAPEGEDPEPKILNTANGKFGNKTVDSEDATIFVVEKAGNQYRLKFKSDSRYLSCGTVKELTFLETADETSLWDITIEAGILTMSRTLANESTCAMKYNSGSPRFTTYASGQQNLEIYAIPGVPPTPEQSSEESSSSPEQSSEESSSIPEESSETPAESSEAPAESSETPAESSEAPVESSEAPAESSEAPAESSEAPEESSVAPSYSEEALRFGERFIKNIVCDGGVTAPNVGRWNGLADLFHELGQDDQEAFMDARASENGNAVEAAVARYDFIIHKYGTRSEENPEGYVDFMSRFTDMVNVGIINRSVASNSNRRTMAIVTTTVFGAALLGAGLIAFSLKRKHKEDK